MKNYNSQVILKAILNKKTLLKESEDIRGDLLSKILTFFTQKKNINNTEIQFNRNSTFMFESNNNITLNLGFKIPSEVLIPDIKLMLLATIDEIAEETFEHDGCAINIKSNDNTVKIYSHKINDFLDSSFKGITDEQTLISLNVSKVLCFGVVRKDKTPSIRLEFFDKLNNKIEVEEIHNKVKELFKSRFNYIDQSYICINHMCKIIFGINSVTKLNTITLDTIGSDFHVRFLKSPLDDCHLFNDAE